MGALCRAWKIHVQIILCACPTNDPESDNVQLIMSNHDLPSSQSEPQTSESVFQIVQRMMIDRINRPGLAIIAAMDRNGLIGANGKLPWHIPEDLAFFKQITMGSIVVMGRRTWQSLNSPLPGRENVVLTRNLRFSTNGARVLHGVSEVVEYCDGKRAFIIGGEEVFRQFLPLANCFYQTLINREYYGDTWFPDWDKNDWKLELSTLIAGVEAVSINIYTRG